MNIELDQPQLDALIKLVEREHRMWASIVKDAEERTTSKTHSHLARYAYMQDSTRALADHLKGYQP